ncbi:MAG TPA: SGNH/GDSL hydrolase family protein [Acidimicrobiia bacterium]|nr:SGNH/GDSL hydrolase family protein [Acidimicrobiia bacterium]
MNPRLAIVAVFLLIAACGDDDGAVTTEATTTTTSATTTTAATTTTTTAPASTSTTVPKRPFRILALGDSYTIGESVAEADRWPVQLGRALEDAGWPPVEVEIVARTGWTTSELDRGIDNADPQGPYDLVTLLIGVNNQYRGLDPEQYRTEFAALLDRARGFSAGPVLVVSIPDWGVTPFASRSDPATVAAEIDLFNEIGREGSLAADVPFVDITPISRSDDPSLVARDGLHPSGAQYTAWVDVILPVALDLVQP